MMAVLVFTILEYFMQMNQIDVLALLYMDI